MWNKREKTIAVKKVRSSVLTKNATHYQIKHVIVSWQVHCCCAIKLFTMTVQLNG